jgi:hypothetical protein
MKRLPVLSEGDMTQADRKESDKYDIKFSLIMTLQIPKPRWFLIGESLYKFNFIYSEYWGLTLS